jgi:hypothetical protein
MQALYGREEVVGRARAALEQAARGAGRLLLFTGEPGIGKSRLAEQVASDAQSQGWAVAWGRCWEAGGAPAYWPWRQVFRSLEMEADPFADTAADLAPAAAELRFAVFERAVRRLQESARRQPLLLVLDDLHAADAPSLLLLLLLARELSRAPICVVGAYREAELRLTPEIAGLLAKVAREADVSALPRLSPGDVAAWLQAADASASPARAESLYRLTEGHPLLIVETLRLRALQAGPWPAQPGAVLDERLAPLAPAVRAALEVAAVIGREFSAAEVAAAGGLSADQVAEALRAALAASILVPAAALDSFCFSHVLLRDRLYRDILPSRRAALHARTGERLLALGDPQAAAHHLFAGQLEPGQGDPAGARERVARVALAAAEASLSRLAFEDAVGLGRRALALAAAAGAPCSPPLQAQLELVVAEAQIRLGEASDGRQLAAHAAELAERAGAPELLARAALVYGTELMSGSLDEQMISLLRKAQARLGEAESPLSARVCARLAAALTPPRSYHDAPEIVGLMRSATSLARRLGDRHTLLYVLQFAATVTLLVPDAERFARIEETLELARALEQRLVLLLTLPAYLTALLVRGDRDRAEAELPGYDRLLEEFPQPLHQVRRAMIGALLSLLDGDLEGAERRSAELRALVQRCGASPARSLWLTQRLSFAQLRCQPELVLGEADALVQQFGTMLGSAPYMAWMLAGLGRREEALERLALVPVESLEMGSANLMDLMGLAEAALVLGDREKCHEVYPRLLRATDRAFWNIGPGSIFGPTGRILGDLARVLGAGAAAVRHYDEAIAACERMRAPLLVELCRRGRAAALALPEPAIQEPEGPAPARPREPRGSLRLQREGDIWTLASAAGALVRLRHSKGLSYLQALLEQPGRQLHVLELAGIDHATGDAGIVLDPRAKEAYRSRLIELRGEQEEAEQYRDVARAERCAHEIEAIAEQLAGAVGLGGRDRRAASDVERARINVQRRLKDVVERVSAADPGLGRYLRAALSTGTFCCYQPL